MSMQEVMRAIKEKDTEALRKMFGELSNSSFDEQKKYDCLICNDSGWVEAESRNGYNFVKPCGCMKIKQSRLLLERSGLQDAIAEMTFDSYQAKEQWQQALLLWVKDFTAQCVSGSKNWMYIGGQVGSGKTHLCTAVCGALLKNSIPVRYMFWQDEAHKIKAGTNDQEVLDELLEPLKSVQVLYIDDLFKGVGRDKDGRLLPSAADLKLAFEIFNMRYVRKLVTIISGEFPILDLLDADQGTFSRVYQMCKQYTTYIKPDKAKNWRLR